MPDLVSPLTFSASFPDERPGAEHVVNVARLLRGRCRLHKESVMSDLAPVPGLRPVRLDDKTKSIMDRAIAREQSLSRLLMTFIVTGLIFVLLPGTFLGVWNLIKISSRQAVNSVSPAWIQAHGHAQLFGWVGTFILGIGFYSIPKLRKLKPFALREGWLCLALWVVGVTSRWFANIYPWHWRVLLPISAAFEFLAFLIFFRAVASRSEEHTSELQSRLHLVCRLLLEKKKKSITYSWMEHTDHHIYTI